MINIKEILAKVDRENARKGLSIPNLLRKAAKGPETVKAEYRISSIANDARLVIGQVYAPDSIDAHGHFMSKEEVRNVAHQFLADGLLGSIDVNHDNELIDATIVESFIARPDDPDFEEGSWVAVTKINDPVVWLAVKNGELNGYSFEILTYKDEMVVEFEYSTWYYGFTDPNPHDKHDHPFMVRLDENGEIVWGKTGPGSDGSPGHTIKRSNHTEKVDGHTHRIHLRDQ